MKSLSLVFFLFYLSSSNPELYPKEEKILSYSICPKNTLLKMYWKDSLGRNYSSLGKLKSSLENKSEKLIFAMNGGMYLKDASPQGLYIENGNIIKNLDTIKKAYGNFYLQPNGVFFLSKQGKAFVRQSSEFVLKDDIKYATQSGPMLLINGEIHPKFTKGSNNINIRNGVGILENGDVLFAMSKDKINLYDFANYFLSKGCKNALYLDGFVSKTYCPSKNWNDLGGNFGVIIGLSERVKS